MKSYKTKIDMIKGFHKEYKPKHVCEVGVFKGNLSKVILTLMKDIEKMYLVDLWEHQPNYKDHSNKRAEVFKSLYQETLEKVSPWIDKVEVLKGFSTDMCKKIPDNSLDWVFIDARHDYKGCSEDLHAYYPKVKSGGIVSGHDYMTAAECKKCTPNQDWSICQDGSINEGAVKGAVNDFASKINKTVTTTQEQCFPCWYFIK